MTAWMRRIKPRTKPRRGQPTTEEKATKRAEVYRRSGGRCELNLSLNHIPGVLPESGISPFDHWHLVHLKAKRRFGWGMDNMVGGCWPCHLIEIHNSKSVPAKVREV